MRSITRTAAVGLSVLLCLCAVALAFAGSSESRARRDTNESISTEQRNSQHQRAGSSDTAEKYPCMSEILNEMYPCPSFRETGLHAPSITRSVVCGDADNSGFIDIDDVVYLVEYIFSEGPPPVPEACVGDADNSGSVDIDDAVYLVLYIFNGGPPPMPDCCALPSGWQCTGPLDGNGPSTLECSPTNPDTVFVGTDGHNGLLEALFRSTDRGSSWEVLLEGDCVSLAIDPTDTRTLYAGILYDLMKSADGGETWDTLEAENLYPYFWYAEFLSLTLDPSDPDIIYACGADVFMGYFLFVSVDAGETWSMLLNYYENPGIHKLVVDPQSQSTLYGAVRNVGIYKSTDGGASWQWKNVGLTDLAIFDIEIGTVTDRGAQTTVVYVATYGGGVFRSDDGAESWHGRSDGLTSPNTTELFIQMQDGNSLYVGADSGVFNTVDGGLIWVPTSNLPTYHFSSSGEPVDLPILGLAAAASNWSSIYTSRFDIVYGSTDGGQGWELIGLPITQITTIEISPFDHAKVYSGCMFGRAEFYFSADRGENWIGWIPPVPTPSGVTVIKAHPGDSSSIYLGSYNGGSGFYRSYDGGETWNWMCDGLDDMKDRCIEDLALDPGDGEVIYLGTLNGVFKSRNGGGVWEETGLTVDTIHITCIETHPEETGIVYAGTYRKGLYRTTDGGVFWTKLDTGLEDAKYMAMAVDTDNPAHLYVGTLYNGILKSTDAGDSWYSVGSGLGSSAIRALLTYNPSPGITHLYAGTWGEGVYRSTDGGAEWYLMDPGGMPVREVGALEYTLSPENVFILLVGTYGGGVCSQAIE